MNNNEEMRIFLYKVSLILNGVCM